MLIFLAFLFHNFECMRQSQSNFIPNNWLTSVIFNNSFDETKISNFRNEKFYQESFSVVFIVWTVLKPW